MISSVELVQLPLLIVHLNVALAPIVNPVIAEVGELAVVIVAVPEVTLQVPVPIPAELADIVVLVTLHKFWSEPALAVVGN